MFKKIFAIATVMCVIPVMANAGVKWQLGTRAMSQGGVVNSRNMTGQTVYNGSIFKQYTTATNSTVTVAANPGFKISKISNNGVISVPASSPYIFTPTGTGPVTIQGTFARVGFTITATAGAGGTVDKSGYPVVYSGVQSPVKSFVFTPAPGQFVSSVTVSGAGAVAQNLNAVTGLPITLPAAANVKVKTNITTVGTANVVVTGAFGGTAAELPPVDPANCQNCHNEQGVGTPTIAASWTASLHNNGFHPANCDNCHIGVTTGAHPGSDPKQACASCHTGQYGYPGGAPVLAADVATCEGCHSTVDGIHSANTPVVTSCIACHDVAIKHPGNVVNDNNGVRSITQEFTKWSHHVTGVALQDAHCAACHLEGEVVAGAVVPSALHMSDAIINLRNADTDADIQWDPAAPNHTNMDNFCMSCHDANGAISPLSAGIRAVMVPAPGKVASASNPFADTISNRYDKMFRPAVVNVDDQFDVNNNSHHGVKGPRYTGRTRAGASRVIASPATFAANSTATLYGKRSTIYDSVNATTGVSELATNPAFTTLYTPLANAGGEVAPRTGAATLGDDSTLHCGDCHTVGQWKAGSAKNANGTATTAVIGAHGSNNEYMLRNDQGIDERHTQEAYTVSAGVVSYSTPNAARLICYNCHSFKRYGSVYSATGATGPHAGEYDASGRCNGVGNTIPFNGYTTGTATDGTQFESRIGEFTRAEASSTPAFAPGFPLNFANAPGGVQAATYTGEQDADFGNIFGIQCLNCHNSGIGNGYGGIHGSANNSPGTANTALNGGYANPDPAVLGGAYVDGMGNTTKVQRFLPGLGNVMYVPGTLGGYVTAGTPRLTFNSGATYNFTTGAITSDTNWEQVGWKQTAAGPTAGATGKGAGCYTLNDEGTGSSLDDPNSATYGIKGQPWDGTTTQTPNAAKTWGGCDDHTGTSVGGTNYGFYKRINRPVTY